MLLRAGFLLMATVFVSSIQSNAQVMVYVTDEPGNMLYEMNFETGARTTLCNVTGRPDSLIVYPLTGQVFFTVAQSRLLEMYDPSTGVCTVLASFATGSAIPGYPRDLVLEPSGITLLVGLYSPGKIVRYNILTGALTLVAKNLGATDGLAYDSNGDLFAVSRHNTIVQIDPLTGLILNKLVLYSPNVGTDGADGLTFDPVTGNLWAAVACFKPNPCPLVSGAPFGNSIIEVPTNLSTFTQFQSGKVPIPDGIISDGQGNLYIGAALKYVMQYNIATDTITASVKAPGVDDMALVPSTF